MIINDDDPRMDSTACASTSRRELLFYTADNTLNRLSAVQSRAHETAAERTNFVGGFDSTAIAALRCSVGFSRVSGSGGGGGGIRPVASDFIRKVRRVATSCKG